MVKRNKDLEDRYQYNYSSYNFDEEKKSSKWLSYFKMLRTSEYNIVVIVVSILAVICIGWIGIEVYQVFNSEGSNTLLNSFNAEEADVLPLPEEGVKQ